MTTAMIFVFVAGYFLIATEHSLNIDKAATAMITGVLCWLLFFLGSHSTKEAEITLLEHLGEISAILFFLLGAMTIVDVIDSHNGFTIVTDLIKTRSKTWILVLISLLTFFLSAVLDNLTTSIVMTSLTAKLIHHRKDRLWFASMIIIAANAGGAWSPIGDVTTTMLWIGGQITAGNIIVKTLIPSLMVIFIPLVIGVLKFRGQTIDRTAKAEALEHPGESRTILFSGIGLLLSVPVFKTLTHMPPFMGMLLALGTMWIISSLLHKRKNPDIRLKHSVAQALRRIDTASILFFLGILLAVSALQVSGILSKLADFAASHLENIYLTGAILGLLSAIIDNVPLVAAAQGMFDLSVFPTDHAFWEFLALSAGTGGSAIIIGSAAGVAVMGIEKIDFFWYLKKISWLALVGFFSGLFSYVLLQQLIG